VTPSHWLITCQQPVFGFEPGNTFYVCMDCLAGLMFAYVQTQQPDPQEETLPLPDGPGVLEQIEADEGAKAPAASNGRARKSTAPAAVAEVVADSEEAAPADVDG
jgi:hypothetical protein